MRSFWEWLRANYGWKVKGEGIVILLLVLIVIAVIWMQSSDAILSDIAP